MPFNYTVYNIIHSIIGVNSIDAASPSPTRGSFQHGCEWAVGVWSQH